jgi:3-oxoadipate enol-lactonase
LEIVMGIVSTILGPLFVEVSGGRGQPVALLWPSLFTDHTMWRYQIPALQTSGFRTLTLDPPGHGRSVGPDRVFTLDECAQAALQVLDAENVHTPIVVLGTSWGGMVAPRMALQAPERVRGMALFNTTAESADLFAKLKARLLAALLPISTFDRMVDKLTVPSMLAPATKRSRPELADELTRTVRSWKRAGLTYAVRSVLVERDSVLDRLSRVEAPALVVSGEEDMILPAEHSRRMIEKLRNARHVELADVAHLAPLEAADAVNLLIHDFIAGLPHN